MFDLLTVNEMIHKVEGAMSAMEACFHPDHVLILEIRMDNANKFRTFAETRIEMLEEFLKVDVQVYPINKNLKSRLKDIRETLTNWPVPKGVAVVFDAETNKQTADMPTGTMGKISITRLAQLMGANEWAEIRDNERITHFKVDSAGFLSYRTETKD